MKNKLNWVRENFIVVHVAFLWIYFFIHLMLQ